MSEFDKIIGYEEIKRELMQMLDMLENREKYESLGARMPRGIMLSGKPGLGKTMLAEAFIKESGLPYITVRRSKASENFTEEIVDAFASAKEQAPAIVFLDDMDKFANEDENKPDAPEYVAIQASIDDNRDEDILIIATVNDRRKLPESLIRAGRFDRRISVFPPEGKDLEDILSYYMNGRRVGDDVNAKDIAKMMNKSTCAELETAMNEAAIYAGFEGSETIGMKHIVDAVLKLQYDTVSDFKGTDYEERKANALHEAGHLVVAEAIRKGSVGLASIRASRLRESGGFIHLCEDTRRRPHCVMIGLGGKAAVEMYYGGRCASGCQSDLARATDIIRDGIIESGTHGLGFVEPGSQYRSGEGYYERADVVTVAELERMMFKVKQVILDNRALVERVRDELADREVLLYSDIQKIEEECGLIAAPEV